MLYLGQEEVTYVRAPYGSSKILEEIIIIIRDLIDFYGFLMFDRFKNLRFEDIR